MCHNQGTRWGHFVPLLYSLFVCFGLKDLVVKGKALGKRKSSNNYGQFWETLKRLFCSGSRPFCSLFTQVSSGSRQHPRGTLRTPVHLSPSPHSSSSRLSSHFREVPSPWNPPWPLEKGDTNYIQGRWTDFISDPRCVFLKRFLLRFLLSLDIEEQEGGIFCLVPLPASPLTSADFNGLNWGGLSHFHPDPRVPYLA